ncbi:MAG: DinB family protein [Flavitalea sp.]
MEILDLLRKEFEQESAMTRKMLERVPEDKWDWKPHEKSMTMKQLTVHLAEIPGWPKMAFNTEVLDFAATPYVPTPINSVAELLSLHDKSAASGKDSLQNAKEEDLLPTWTMKYGDTVIMSMTKYEMIRHSLCQQTHHRAQLGVYLRLLDIPIPGTYGPSADDSSF